MPHQVAGHLAMLLFSALVAGSFALGALIANDVPPLVLTLIRFVITAFVLGGLVLASQTPDRADFSAPWRFLALGTCLVMYFVLMFEGLKTAPAVSLSAEFTLAPLITGAIGYVLLGQLFTRRVVIALSIGALGALWVIFQGDISALLGFEIGRGEVIFFIGMSFYALYAPLLAKLHRNSTPLVLTFAISLGAIVVILPFALPELLVTDLRGLGFTFWAVTFYLAIFASAVTFALIQFAALHLPSVKVMAYTYLIPSWVVVWQFFLGQSAVSQADIIGLSLTSVALILLLKNQDA